MSFKVYSEDTDFDKKYYKNRPESFIMPGEKYEVDAIPLTKSEIETLTNKHLYESVLPHPTNEKRVIIKADHEYTPQEARNTPVGVMLPKHSVDSMNRLHKNRLEVYGKIEGDSSPISAKQVSKKVKAHADDHFTIRDGETAESARERQIKDEKEAVERLKRAGFLSNDGDFFSDSEKTETLKHDAHPVTGERYEDAALKGTAAYDAHLDDEGRHHIVKTCPGQSEGCGGGIDSERLADPKKGLCFAPNAETQYVGARAKRHAMSVASHSPNQQIQKDFALALIHNIRNRHASATKKGLSLVVRPDTTDQTDNNKTRHIVDKLNEQGRALNGEKHKNIMTYAYGKTNEINDPKIGHHRVFSNIGPKVKNGKINQEAVADDKNRVNQTVTLNSKNKENKNSYLVVGGKGVKKGTALTDRFAKSAHVGVYWEAGKHHSELTDEEKSQPDEAHYDENGKLTTFENSHYGHITKGGMRFYYQKQHMLHQHNNKVDVGIVDKKGKAKPVESDARFLDNAKAEAQGKKPFVSRTGAKVGHLIVSTPTKSTSNKKILENSMVHDVNEDVVKEAEKHGFYHIDHPDEQLKAMSTPTDIKGSWKKGQGKVD